MRFRQGVLSELQCTPQTWMEWLIGSVYIYRLHTCPILTESTTVDFLGATQYWIANLLGIGFGDTSWSSADGHTRYVPTLHSSFHFYIKTISDGITLTSALLHCDSQCAADFAVLELPQP